MGYMSFNEFVEKQKKNGHKKPKIAVVPDYDGPMPSAPEHGEKGKKSKAAPYKGGKDAPDRNKDDASALGHKGHKSDHNMPKAKHHNTTPGTELKSYPNIKTQEWIDRNKKLSLAEFTKKVRSEKLENLGGKNPSIVYASIKESVNMCESSSYVRDFILELKRQGLFEEVFLTMTRQNEAMSLIGKLIENDKNFSKKMLLAMNELTAGSVGMDDESGDGAVSEPMGDENHDGDHDGDHDEDHDEDHDGDHDEDHDEDHDDDMDDEDHDDDMDDEDHDDDMEGENHHDDMGGEDEPHMGDKSLETMPSQPKENSPLMKAMKNNPEMMKRMMGRY